MGRPHRVTREYLVVGSRAELPHEPQLDDEVVHDLLLYRCAHPRRGPSCIVSVCVSVCLFLFLFFHVITHLRPFLCQRAALQIGCEVNVEERVDAAERYCGAAV